MVILILRAYQKKTGLGLSELLGIKTTDVGVILEDSLRGWIDDCYIGRVVTRVSESGGFTDAMGAVDVIFEDYMNYQTADRMDQVMEYADYVNKKSEYLNNGGGISTGIKKLDDYTMGLSDPMVWVVGGYSGAGKTYMLVNMAIHLLKQGKSFLMFSLEMSSNQIIDRMVSMITGLSNVELFITLDEKRHDKRKKARAWVGNKIKDGSLRIITEARDIHQIAREIKVAYRENNYYAFGVDYIQLIGGDGEEYSVIRSVSLNLQELSKRYRTTAILLSQISNEANKSGNMFVSFGYKGAGEIGQIADIGIRIGRGEGENGEPNEEYFVSVVKNRHGSTGRINCKIQFPGGKITESEIAFDDIAK